MCMCLFSCVCQSLNSYFRMKCVYWQWFSEVFLSPCSDFQQRTVSRVSVLFFQRSRPFIIGFWPCPLCAVISPASRNLLIILWARNDVFQCGKHPIHLSSISLCTIQRPFTANMTNNAWSSYKLKVCFPCYVISLLICWCVFSNLLNLRVMYESW